MLLMADLRARECRSPAVPPTVCDFGIEELGMAGTAGAERDVDDVLCCADVWVECGAEEEEEVDGSTTSARWWGDADACGGLETLADADFSLSR